MPQKLRCEVEEVIQHGERVYSLILRPERPVMRFIPGQFLHLTLEDYQPGDFWPDSRVFSIASAPAERDHLRITYAVKGNFTSRMEAELHPGRTVWVKLPYGDFIVTPERDVCILAGGTGITAFTAFISGLGADYPTPGDALLRSTPTGFTDLPVVGRILLPNAAQTCRLTSWLKKSMKGQIACQGASRSGGCGSFFRLRCKTHYYLSGPPDMLHALRAELHGRDVPAGQVHIDAWE